MISDYKRASGVFLCALAITEALVLPELPVTEEQLKNLRNSICIDLYLDTSESVMKSCHEKLNGESVKKNVTVCGSKIEMMCQRNTWVTFEVRPTRIDAWPRQLVILLPIGNNTALIRYTLMNINSKIGEISIDPAFNYTFWSTLLNNDATHCGWSLGPNVTILNDITPVKYHIKQKIPYQLRYNSSHLSALFKWLPLDREDLCYEVRNYCPGLTVEPEYKKIMPQEEQIMVEQNLPLNTTCFFEVLGQRGFLRHEYHTQTADMLQILSKDPEKADKVTLHADTNAGGVGWDILVTWAYPYRRPDSYNLTLFYEKEPIQNLTMPGDVTEATFLNVTGQGEYTVKVAAVASGKAFITSESGPFPLYVASPLGSAAATGGALGGVGVAIAALLWYSVRRNAKRRRSSVEVTEKFTKVEYFESEAEFSSTEDQWEVCSKRVTLHEVVGEGAFGLVRRGTLAPSQRDVAVKMLKDFPSVEEIRSFRAEMELMKSVGRHAHVVGLVGCYSGRRPLILVEYCAKGDLLTFLRRSWDVMVSKRNSKYYNNNTENSDYRNNLLKTKSDESKIAINKLYDINGICDPEMTLADLISFCRQIALGMEFLASNRVVHRDLAARNVLVTEDKTLKIADFGLSRDVYQENQYKQKGNGKMPVKWMALESLTLRIYTTQSDVWSFGVVMWEVMTVGGSPYAGVSATRLLRLLRAGYRLPRPTNCTPELYEVMCLCWSARAHRRPTFNALVARLDALLHAASAHRYLALDLDPSERDLAAPMMRSFRDKYLPMLDNMKRVFGRGSSYERPRDTAQSNHYTSPPYTLAKHLRNHHST